MYHYIDKPKHSNFQKNATPSLLNILKKSTDCQWPYTRTKREINHLQIDVKRAMGSRTNMAHKDR